MKSFQVGQRVVVVNYPTPCDIHLMVGTVIRLRMSDEGAWVQMDREPPADLRHFGDGDSRQYHILLYPKWCELEAKKKTKGK